MAEHVASKKDPWGDLNGVWVPHDVRDRIVDFVRCWSEKTELGAGQFIVWLGIAASKFYNWRERYGKVNEHNGWIPGISGWRSGRSTRSSIFIGRIRWKAIGV